VFLTDVCWFVVSGYAVLHAVYAPYFDRQVNGILELNIQLGDACFILDSVVDGGDVIACMLPLSNGSNYISFHANLPFLLM